MIRQLRALTAGMALCLAATAAQAEELEIRIGVEGAYPPFSHKNADGQLIGFDVDIAHALCAAMKAKCTLVEQDWDGIIPALLARKYDAIVASMAITEERKKRVDFSRKYYNSPAKFAARAGVAASATLLDQTSAQRPARSDIDAGTRPRRLCDIG